jgi:Zn finger protein HypA/HybF involved in hydrogenase expression
MKIRAAKCPGCGGTVEFRASSSLVTICEYCNSAVARVDKRVEDHGKIADLVQTQSRLKLGMNGNYRGKRFDVVGRVQYLHAAGGAWNEWYLLFPGEHWGWLAESQGRYYLSFEERLKSTFQLPDFDSVQLGQSFNIKASNVMVTEKGTATLRSAEGEIPWDVRPNAKHQYADLRGDEGVFATFEFGLEPRIFLGHSVGPDDLKLSGDAAMVPEESIPVSALKLSCPKCAGALTLYAPDESLRVTCPSCSAMLDVSHGKLAYLQTLKIKQVHPVLALGAKGKLKGNEYTVIGFMERFVLYNGTAYPWTEYLLYSNSKGFRWLVNSSGHWSFVEQIDFPSVWPPPASVRYQSDSYRKYDCGRATVRYVLGEFSWRVEIGEETETIDYIAPPHMLSFEQTVTSGANNADFSDEKQKESLPSRGSSEEINVSLATYLSVDELEEAFGLSDLRRPWGVGAIQPSPNLDGRRILYCNLGFVGLIALIHVAFSIFKLGKGTDIGTMLISMLLVSLMPLGLFIYKRNFEVKRWANSDFSPYAQGE